MKKKFKRPRTCQIGGLTYKIRYVVPGRGKLLGKGELGTVCQTDHLIELDTSMSEQMTLLVLLHEFCHAIGDCIRANKNPFLKEDFTSTVSELLLQALQSSGLLST